MSTFSISLNPADYSTKRFALRTSTDGWATDLDPDPMSDAKWTLDQDHYQAGFEFKFLLVRDDADRSKDLWMLGYNLQIPPLPDGFYTFTAEHFGPIAFPFFVRLVGNRFAASLITVRDQANGWVDRSGSHDGTAWSFAIPWTDYFDSSGEGPVAVRYKFVRDGQWMDGPNLQIGPDEPYWPGEFAQVGQTYDTDDTTVSFPSPNL